MKITTLFVIIGVLVLGLGFVYFKQNSTRDAAAIPLTNLSQESGVSLAHPGYYGDYSPEALRAHTGKNILFFKAAWCGTCTGVDEDIIRHQESIPEEVAIYIIDYDTAQTLRQKYGVTVQHTFVQVDEAGNELKQWLGSPTLAAILEEIV